MTKTFFTKYIFFYKFFLRFILKKLLELLLWNDKGTFCLPFQMATLCILFLSFLHYYVKR